MIEYQRNIKNIRLDVVGKFLALPISAENNEYCPWAVRIRGIHATLFVEGTRREILACRVNLVEMGSYFGRNSMEDPE